MDHLCRIVVSEPLINSWPWWKRWAWLAWDYIKWPIAPILAAALALTLFQVSFALILSAFNR